MSEGKTGANINWVVILLNFIILVLSGSITIVVKFLRGENRETKERLDRLEELRKDQDKNLLNIMAEQDKVLKEFCKEKIDSTRISLDESKNSIGRLFERTEQILRNDERIKNLEKIANGKIK